MTDEDYETIMRRYRPPAYNPLNALDASIKLARPCEKCGAREGQPCLEPCRSAAPRLGPSEIRVMPGDDHDTNPEQHERVKSELWRRAL